MNLELSSSIPHFLFYTALLALLPFSGFAATADANASNNTAALQASAEASKEWLGLLDKEQYGASWDASSNLMKLTIKKNSWEKVMTETRKPLGNMIKRDVLDQRTAKNPPGMPHGDYIVMFYKTSFAKKSEAYELVTLFLQNGKWSVVTYQVDQEKMIK